MSADAFLKRAVALAVRSVGRGGGPFGAVVVRGGRVVGEGHNRVTLTNDPSAHAEVVAIRDACRRLRTFSLDGCVLYASCEPCPMCLATSLWARVRRIVYAADRFDAFRAGFDDAAFYRELRHRPAGKLLPLAHRRRQDAGEPFRLWLKKTDRIPY